MKEKPRFIRVGDAIILRGSVNEANFYKYDGKWWLSYTTLGGNNKMLTFDTRDEVMAALSTIEKDG